MGGSGTAKTVVDGDMAGLEKNLSRWVKQTFGFSRRTLSEFSSVRVFNVKSDPLDESDFKTWKDKHGKWLNDFGLNLSSGSTYFNNKTLLCAYTPSASSARWVATLAFRSDVNAADENDSNGFEEFGCMSVSVGTGLLAITESFTLAAEGIRAMSYQATIRRRGGVPLIAPIGAAARSLLVKIERTSQQITEGSSWIGHELSNFEPLKRVFDKKTLTLPQIVLPWIAKRIDSVANVQKALASQLSEQLAIENLAVTYNLQRRMFFLTWATTIAALLTLATDYDKLEQVKMVISDWIFSMLY